MCVMKVAKGVFDSLESVQGALSKEFPSNCTWMYLTQAAVFGEIPGALRLDHGLRHDNRVFRRIHYPVGGVALSRQLGRLLPISFASISAESLNNRRL